METKIKINIVKKVSEAKTFVDFFIANTTPVYISYGELQCKRAKSPTEWSDNLYKVLLSEFKSAIKSTKYSLIKVELGSEIIAMALINFDKDYAILEDGIVKQEYRSKGVGKEMLNYVEAYLKKKGIKKIFLESGIFNMKAHNFFEVNGYKVVSKVFYKKL